MSAKLARTLGALAIAVPLVVAAGQAPAGAYYYPAENDCTAPFGAITQQPGPNPDCYGLDFGSYPQDEYSPYNSGPSGYDEFGSSGYDDSDPYAYYDFYDWDAYDFYDWDPYGYYGVFG